MRGQRREAWCVGLFSLWGISLVRRGRALGVWVALLGVCFADIRTTQAQERTWELTLPLRKKPQVVVYQLIQPERLVFEMPSTSVIAGYTWPTSWPSWIMRVQRQSYRAGRQEMKRWIFSFQDAFRYQIRQQEAWSLRVFPPSMRALPWLVRYQAERGDLLVASTPYSPSHRLTKQPSHRNTQAEDPRFVPSQKERIQREQQAQREKERIQREQQQAQREKERIQREQQAQREKERMQREQQAQREKERMQREQQAQREKERMQREQQAQREKERIQREHRLLVSSHLSNAATFGSLRSFTKAEQGLHFAQTKREIAALASRVERLVVRSVLGYGEQSLSPSRDMGGRHRVASCADRKTAIAALVAATIATQYG